MILSIILIAIFVIEGIYQIITGKFLGDSKSAQKYEPKSYARCTRIGGVLTLFLAFGLFIRYSDDFKVSFGFPNYVGLIVAGVFAAALICLYLFGPKKIKPGSNASSNGSSDNEEYIDED